MHVSAVKDICGQFVQALLDACEQNQGVYLRARLELFDPTASSEEVGIPDTLFEVHHFLFTRRATYVQLWYARVPQSWDPPTAGLNLRVNHSSAWLHEGFRPLNLSDLKLRAQQWPDRDFTVDGFRVMDVCRVQVDPWSGEPPSVAPRVTFLGSEKGPLDVMSPRYSVRLKTDSR